MNLLHLTRRTPGHWPLALLLLLALPLPASASLDTARQEWEAGQIESAVVRLKAVLQQDPDNAAARLLLGQIYLESGEAAAAEQELTRARDAGADDIATRIGLAEALLLQSEASRALEWTEPPAGATSAQQAELLALRGRVLLLQDKALEAAQAFSAAVKADPEALQPLLGMASLELQRGDQDAAAASIRRAIELHPDAVEAWQALANLERLGQRNEAAIQALDRAVQLARVKWPYRYQRADLYLDLGNAESAAADIDALGDMPRRMPFMDYLEGRLALLQGDQAAAVERLEAYLRVAPGDMRAIYHAALALNLAGRHAQAEEYLLRLTSAVPDSAAAATLLARTRLAQGNAAGAEEALRPIAEAPDATPAALELLRQALVRQDRRDEADAVVERAAKRFPQLSSVQLAYADQLQREGDVAGSIELLRAAIESEPDNQLARVLLIRAHIMAGDTDAALQAAEDYLVLAPDSPMALAAKGAILAQQGKTQEARLTLGQALELNPGFQRAALALAALELGTDRPEQAREALDKLLETDPDNQQVTLARAAMDLREDDTEGFNARLLEALERNPAALQLRLVLARSHLASGRADAARALLEDAPQEQQDQAPLLLLRARAELAADEPAAATATLTTLAERNPGIARYRYMLASLYADQGDLRAASVHLEQGLDLDRGQELEHERLARILQAQPTAEARKAMLERLLSLAPGHPTLQAAKARFLIQQADYATAIGILRGLATEHPEDAEFTLWLAEATSKTGRTAAAQKLVQDWLQDHPNNLPMRLASAQLGIEAGDYASAIDEYRRVLEADGSNALALNNLAMLLAETSPDEALDYADRALALDPDEPAYIDTKGAVLMAKGDFGGAAQLLAKAHAKSPDPSIAFRYAKSLAEIGDKGAARRVLLSLQAQSFPEKAEAEALLTRLAGGD